MKAVAATAERATAKPKGKPAPACAGKRPAWRTSHTETAGASTAEALRSAIPASTSSCRCAPEADAVNGVADAPATEHSATTPAAIFDEAASDTGTPVPDGSAYEALFGVPLSHVRLHSGPAARRALNFWNARAATRGSDILVDTPAPDAEVLAHELAHVSQQRSDAPESAAPVEPAGSRAERDANHIGTRAAHMISLTRRSDATPQSLRAVTPAAGARPALDGRVIALLRSSSAPAGAPAPGGGSRAPGGAGVAGGSHSNAGNRAPATGSAATGNAAPASASTPAAPASAPALGNAEAPASAEANTTPEGGETAGGEQVAAAVLSGFATATPTQKAAQQATIAAAVSGAIAQEATTVQDELPEFHATLATQVEQPAALTVAAPAANDIVVEPVAPASASAPEIDPTAPAEPYTANAGAAGRVASRLGDDPAAREGELGQAISEVHTTDPGIVTSPGAVPAVPRDGDADPTRIDAQRAESSRATTEALIQAQQGVVNGPGPEQVQPVALDETYTLDSLNTPEPAADAPAEGAQAYLDMGLPPDVQTAFDEDQGPAMGASAEAARTQVADAARTRDEGRDEQVAQAQEDTQALSREHDQEQRDQVRDARAQIQDSRREAMDRQDQEVRRVESDTEARSEQDRTAVRDRASADEARIDERYDTAERSAAAEVQSGERRASDQRDRARRDSETQSWWDRAVSFVRDAFDALVSAIGAIFDAVRSAVNAILDAAKSFAMAVIDAAASFIRSAIRAFGDFLRAAVQGLLGDIFPGLARWLTDRIDEAVAAAEQLVDAIAERLKQGISALIEGLRAGINALLDAYQAAVNAALAILQAAITGDWSGLLMKVLEAVLRLAGIDPAAFRGMIGQAEDTISTIINNPVGFVGNLIEAFVGGVRLFAGNFAAHLQAGVIGWLTGAMSSAGIIIPAEFNLAGVFDLLRQILGLTWPRLRTRAVRLIGERAVEVLEFVAGYVQTLLDGGWGALFERIREDLGTLRDQVLEGIRTFLLERVVMAAVRWLASLFSPVGAIVQLIMTAWNVYTFVRDQLARLFQIAQTIVGAISAIAQGVLQPAMQRVQGVLASLLPLVIDLLARLLGLGAVGERVRQVIERVQGVIDRAIDALLERVRRLFRPGSRAAAGAAPGAGADTRGAAHVGEAIPFSAGGESHTLSINVRGRDAVVMVASTPTPLQTKLAEWRTRAPTLVEPQQASALRLIGDAEGRLRATDQAADQQANALAPAAGGVGTPPAAGAGAAVVAQERHLVAVLDDLFDIFGEAREPIGRNASDRFERARSIRQFEAGFLRRDWQAQFLLAESTAGEDLRFGISGNRLTQSGGSYRLRVSDAELLETGRRIFLAEARNSPHFHHNRVFRPARITGFFVAHPRMPNDASRYSGAMLQQVVSAAVAARDIAELDGWYRFTTMPAQRRIPRGFDVRERFYIVGSGFGSARLPVIRDGVNRIRRVTLDLDKGAPGAAAAWAALRTDMLVIDALRRIGVDYAAESLFDVDHKVALARHWVERQGNNALEADRHSFAAGNNLRLLLSSINRSLQAGGFQYTQVPWVGPQFRHTGADMNYCAPGVKWDFETET